MEGQRASFYSRRGSPQQGPQHHEQAAMAELERQLEEAQLDRDDLGQELQRAHMTVRLLQSSLTGKICARDELIHQLFDAAKGAGAAVEALEARYAKLARQTAGMDEGVMMAAGLYDGGDGEGMEEALMRASIGDQATLEELMMTRRENQRLQEIIASLQETQALPPAPEAAATAPPPPPIPAEEEGQQGPSANAEALQRVAASCAALSRDFGTARETIRLELQQGVDDVFRKARAGLAELAKAQEGEVGQLRRLYKAEQAERRRLFNLLQELRGNIRVLIRPRPLPAGGGGVGQDQLCMRLAPESGEVSLAYGRKLKQWEYDHVFGLEATQAEVYEEVAPIVGSVLDGYNACVLAYGQTGSGKTHTMQGPVGDRGVNMRALQELFERIAARAEEGVEDEVSISILEIYNESIQDLLAEEGARKWEIKQGPQGMYVTDLTVVPVASLEQVLALLAQGEGCRAKAATNLNEHSSRSHLVLTVYVQSRHAASGVTTRSKIHLVDLAGSERVRKSGAEGQSLKEAQSINRSLSALGDVIHARLAKAAHVPFRNSTLTYLLQDSLSGDSKVLMIVCVSPSLGNAEESSCTLQFAARVRKVELGKATKQVVAADSASSIASPTLDGSASSGSDASLASAVSSGFAAPTASSSYARSSQQQQLQSGQQQPQKRTPAKAR